MDSYLTSYIRVIDIILGLFMIWGGLKGFRRGFVIEFLSLVIFIVGVILVFYLFTVIFVASKEVLGTATKAISFLFFLIAYIIGGGALNFLGRQLQNRINYSIFDDFDNIAGMITGFLKYAIYCSILIGLLDAVGYKLPKGVTEDSLIYPLLLKFQKWLIEVGAVLMPFIKSMARDIENLLK
ncbi:MAG: CvpA family protein [Cytophagales bacterium]|nr:CvpA family protein [Cytophagales bacterium]MDW8384975.1 CvpA family protein [Flammeovirgaceae bacterium]